MEILGEKIQRDGRGPVLNTIVSNFDPIPKEMLKIIKRNTENTPRNTEITPTEIVGYGPSAILVLF